jgi:hypothetical protein
VTDMTALQTYPSTEDAERAAASLVEHGMGATVGLDSSGQWEVSVLADDATRARQLLGVAEPVVSDDENEAELTAHTRSVLLPVLVGAAVLVIVPLIAFFVTFKLSGG